MDFLNNIRELFRENPRMWAAVGGAVIVSGFVVWMVYGQSSFEIGQFFATPAFNQCPYVDRNNPECGCTVTQTGQTRPNKIVIPHVCTRSFQEGNTDYSDGQWFVWDQQGGSPSCPNGFPYITFRTKRDGTTFGTPQACVEKPPDCPEGFHAFKDTFCDPNTGGGSNPKPKTPAPGTPTPSSTAPVVCAPASQTITPGQTASLQASGGNGTFQWNVTGGGVVESGGNQAISISYRVPGTKTVRVNSGTASAACTVVVQAPASVTPITGTVITVQKTARNLSAGTIETAENLSVVPGMTVQFVVTVTSVATVPLSNLVVKDVVPPGMSYRQGSTYIDGQLVSVDTITTTGLSLGTLEPGEEFTARWSAVADRTDQLVTGIQESRPLVTVTANGVLPVSDEVTLAIQGTGTGATPVPAGPGGVQTGPGDAVLIAFMTAAALTLLYTAYTRSPSFIRKEAEKISRDQGPLDFRS